MPKPFNLEKALAGYPLITRDGRKVRYFRARVLSKEQYDTQYPFEAAMAGEDGDSLAKAGYLRTYTSKGTYCFGNRDNHLDLFIDEEEKSVLEEVIGEIKGGPLAAVWEAHKVAMYKLLNRAANDAYQRGYKDGGGAMVQAFVNIKKNENGGTFTKKAETKALPVPTTQPEPLSDEKRSSGESKCFP